MESRVPWISLPRDLIVKIADHLENPSDVRRLRAVCRTWWFFVPLPLNLLSFVLPRKIKTPKNGPFLSTCESSVLVANNIYLLKPRQGPDQTPWMIRVEEPNPGNLQVQRPLRHNLAMHMDASFPRILDLEHVRVSKIFKGYNLKRESRDPRDYWSKIIPFVLNKIVFPDPDGMSPAGIANMTAVVLFLVGYLYVVRLSNDQWKLIKFGRVFIFEDLLNFGGQIFVIDRKARLYQFCCLAMSHTWVVSDPIADHSFGGTRKRLVELHGEMCLVHLVYGYFRFYKLNRANGVWNKVVSLDQQWNLFVSPDCSFSVLTGALSEWGGNLIIHRNDSFRAFKKEDQICYNSVEESPFQIDNASVCNLSVGGYRLASCFKYSCALYPPPQWLRYSIQFPRINNVTADDGHESTEETSRAGTSGDYDRLTQPVETGRGDA